MGIYINTDVNHYKVEWIISNLGGQEIPEPSKVTDVPEDRAIVVVIDNGLFEAAGVAYDQSELDAFLYRGGGDNRPRRYLSVSKQQVNAGVGRPVFF